MKPIARGIFLSIAVAILFAPRLRAQDSQPPAASPSPTSATAPATASTYEIKGSARSAKTPLPGVTVTAANTLTGKKYAAATNFEGKFEFSGMTRGRYVVRIEFMGFAAFTQEVVLNPENPSAKVDAELILASRQQEQSNINNAAIAAAGRGFQSLAMDGTLSTLAGGNSSLGGGGGLGGGQGSSDLSSLPMNGAGAEGPTESVSVSGAQGRTQDFGGGNEQDLQDRIQEFRDRMQREGGGGFGGGGGGGGFGGPGGGIIAMGRMPRGFNINQPHGLLYFSDDNAGLDARPYSLNGIESPKADYNQARFGVNVGGPLNIPKIFNGGNKWFFFGGWNGSRGSSPYDAFSTVPTVPERLPAGRVDKLHRDCLHLFGGDGALELHSCAEYRAADGFRPELPLCNIRGEQFRHRDPAADPQLRGKQRSGIWSIRGRRWRRWGRSRRRAAFAEQY